MEREILVPLKTTSSLGDISFYQKHVKVPVSVYYSSVPHLYSNLLYDTIYFLWEKNGFTVYTSKWHASFGVI